MFVLLYLLDISQRFILQEKQITRTLSSVFLTTHTLHQMSRKVHKLEDSLYCMCKFQSKTYSDFFVKKKKKAFHIIYDLAPRGKPTPDLEKRFAEIVI